MVNLSPSFCKLGTAHYLSVRGRLKSRGGGHVNFHVASRGGGSPLTLTLQQGGHV